MPYEINSASDVSQQQIPQIIENIEEAENSGIWNSQLRKPSKKTELRIMMS